MVRGRHRPFPQEAVMVVRVVTLERLAAQEGFVSVDELLDAPPPQFKPKWCARIAHILRSVANRCTDR